MFAAVACAAVGLSLAAYATETLRSFELSAIDELFTIRGDQPPPRDVVLVRIDEPTLRQLGLVGREPGDAQAAGQLSGVSLFARGVLFRGMHAQVIRRLATAGARVIAYDVSFTEPTTEEDDAPLFESLGVARGRMVLAATEVGPHGEHAVLGAGAQLRQHGLLVGNANLRPDENGVVYRFGSSLQGLQTLAAAAVELFERGQLDSRQLWQGRAWIDYVGAPGRIPNVSFADVLNGRTQPSFFRGKAVVVGAVARSIPGLPLFRTPVGDRMAAAEIEANALATAVRGFPHLGDGLMAVSGAPIELEDHADRALAAAFEVLEVRLLRFNRWLEQMELGPGFRIGIGLNSGVLVAGNVGSERRLEYTAIGDVVNAAARLEASTKGTGQMLLVAESTKSRLRRPPAELVYFDELAVRGREGRIKVWSPADLTRRASA